MSDNLFRRSTMQAQFKVTGIDHVVFHVKDLARAKNFYIDFLGMTVDHESSWQCFLHGGSEVNHMALRLAAGDYEKVKATLENAGIEVHGRKNDPHCVYFSDPDGHHLPLLMPNE